MLLMRFFAVVLFAVSSGFALLAQPDKPVKEYLGVTGPVVFDTKSYNLNWSSHPADNYYKQEYLVKGENADKFKSMMMMEVLIGNNNLKDIVAAKIAELKKIKETNPVAQYESFNNTSTGEYMIDFLLTANDANGEISVMERNVYRYKTITDKAGKKAILLFAMSTRSYGREVDGFLASLKTTKSDLVNKVAKFNIPAIKVPAQ